MPRRKTPVLTRLLARLSRTPGVLESPSGFAEMDAWWVDGKEVAHLQGTRLDLRLTRCVIRELKERLAGDACVTLRRAGSDWLEVDVQSPAAATLAAELFARAVEAHRPPEGRAAALPPSGAALARRRRVH